MTQQANDNGSATTADDRVAQGIADHGPVFTTWVNLVGTDPDELDRFDGAYQGKWDEFGDYAKQFLRDLGAELELSELPNWLRPFVHIDIAAWVADLESRGHLVVVPDTDSGGVHVFDTSF